MKILQIIQRPQRRGAEIFACQLSEELVRVGHHVDVLYLFDQDDFQLNYSLNFISLGANESKRFSDFTAYAKLARLIREGAYDVVQANAGDTLKYTAISKMLYRWKTPLVFRNANNMSSFIRGKLHKLLNSLWLSQCDYFISVSENCRQDLISLFPKAVKRSATITIGTKHFDEVNRYQDDFHHDPVIINIGGLVPEKNHEFLITWFEKVLESRPEACLWIFGEGKERRKLEKMIEADHLIGKVVLWGNQPDVISYLKAADIMVMPSKIEGLPGVILEAMSVGVPVIAAPVGGIPEVVIDKITGFTPESYSTEEYLNIIDSLLSNDNLKREITSNAKKLVDQEFLLPIIASKFEKSYESLLAS